jgi:putative FmdB family regulatory protein
MPIYEYRCAACGREFERYVATPSTAVACPHCESRKVTRRLSLVTLKTSGGLAASPGAAMGGGCCGGGGGCGCH